jgi:hypothetical protein
MKRRESTQPPTLQHEEKRPTTSLPLYLLDNLIFCFPMLVFGLRQGFGIIRMCFSLQKQHISYHPNGAKTSSPVLSFYFWTIETQEVNGVFFWCKQFFYPSAISSFSEFVFSPRPSGISEAWDGLLFRAAAREDIRNRRVSYTAPKRNTKKLIYITFFLEIHVSLNSS